MSTISEDKRKFDQDYHDHHDTDRETLDRTLFAATQALDTHHINYALIGGVAVKNLGRPRVTNDIDLFVSPDDARRILKILAEAGFSTEERDPHWLFKAWRDDVLVDIIFKSSGDIYFDDEMQSRVKPVRHRGRPLNAVSPEDFLVIKAAVHQEHGPHHWHDALAVLKEGNLDWDYLLKRARHSPRRVLALLIYGQSNDIAVPNEIIKRLYRSLYDAPMAMNVSSKITSLHGRESDIYTVAHLKEAIAKLACTSDQNVQLSVSESTVLIKGEVLSAAQRDAILHAIRSTAPSLKIDDRIYIPDMPAPEQSEAVL